MIEFLLEHAEAKPVSYHMPGHKGSELYRRLGYGRWLDNFMDWNLLNKNNYQRVKKVLELSSRSAH